MQPMAASVAVADLVAGPRRPVEVVAATPHAVYLATGDPDLPALCLAGPDAVRVPCALVLAAAPPPGLAGRGWVGGGSLSVGRFAARVARWWRPARPRGLVALDSEVRPLLDHAVPTRAWTAGLASSLLDHAAEAALSGLVGALASGQALTGPVRALLGRGPGLTPLGDDVLAGLLVALHALGAPASARLGAEVRALAPARTTVVSVALLHHAARGECVPELADLLAAVRDGRSAAAAVDALLRVGHTSGAGLLRGAHAAFDLTGVCT